jgi:2-polyprenyl-3-methyl-5-hydroxy-6-metoxy-1,4-benzoquinol methylase
MSNPERTARMREAPHAFVDVTPYDKHFEYRKDFMDIAPRFFLRTNIMLDMLGRTGGTVLDVGCGDGFFLRRLARAGYHGVGIDVSSAGIELAKNVLAEFPQCEVHCAPIQEFRPDAAYPIATCGETLEHIEDDVAFLTQINRLLQPGGTLVLSVPIDISLWTQHDVEAGHFRRYSKTELFEKLQRAGFAVEDYTVWGFPLVRLSHLQIRRAQTRRMGAGARSRKKDLLIMLKPILRLAKHVVRFDNLFNFTERGVGIVVRAVKTR